MFKIDKTLHKIETELTHKNALCTTPITLQVR